MLDPEGGGGGGEAAGERAGRGRRSCLVQREGGWGMSPEEGGCVGDKDSVQELYVLGGNIRHNVSG